MSISNTELLEFYVKEVARLSKENEFLRQQIEKLETKVEEPRDAFYAWDTPNYDQF